MALVTRYFDMSGAGTADGTSYANRAPLLSEGELNSIITSFDFSGSDALLCLLEPGIYSDRIANMALANAPSATKKLFFSTSGFSHSELTSQQSLGNQDAMVRIQADETPSNGRYLRLKMKATKGLLLRVR